MVSLFIPIFIILLSGFCHSLWNLLAKKSIHKLSFIFSFQLIGFFLFLPWSLLAFSDIRVTPKSLVILAITMTAHGFYLFLLSKLYSKSDLSMAYPIIRGTGPLLLPLIGTLFLHEHLSYWGWLGVGAIIIGIFTLCDIRHFTHHKDQIGLALLVGLCVSCYILLDKLAMNYAPMVVVNWLSTVGNVIMLLPLVWKDHRLKEEWDANGHTILAGALLSGLSYMLFLSVLKTGQVAQFVPMREIGTVFGTLLGIFILKEKIIVATVITGNRSRCGSVLSTPMFPLSKIITPRLGTGG